MRLSWINRSLLLIAWTVSSSAGAAESQPAEPRGSFCAEACGNSLAKVPFTDADPELTPEENRCSSRLHLQSMYLCLGLHCDVEIRLDALRDLNQTCQSNTGLTLPPYNIVSGFTDDEISHLPRVNTTSSGQGPVYDEPVLPTPYLYTVWFKTLDALTYVHFHHAFYGLAMTMFWIVVCAVGAFYRALAHYEARQSRRLGPQSWTRRWLKRHVLTPAAFGQVCTRDIGGWGTIPSRAQTLAISLFVALNIGCTVHGYKIFPGNIYFPTETRQILRYVSDRTGIISFANFPLIWLFGMRNNVVIWITGWDFGTFNKFHRWVARVATVQAVIHSVGYTILIFKEWLIIVADGGWSYFVWWLSLMFFWTGELATIFMCALLILSVYWLRRHYYEAFLLIHIVLSILMLITMLGHVSIFGGEYDVFVWVPVFIWVLDRVIRVSRIFLFNVRVWNTKAMATFNPAANIVRLEVPISSKGHKAKPGTYYYLSILNDTKFWESHPFTVASTTLGLPSFEGDERAALLASEESSLDDGPDTRQIMTFLIRPYDGFTARMRDAAAAESPKPALLRLAVDGPYGETLPLHFFDNILFIVGGSGIVVPMTYSRSLAQDSFSDDESVHMPRRVSIHWSVREAGFVSDTVKQDFEADLNSANINTHVYFTGDCGPDGPIENRDDQYKISWSRERLDAPAAVREAARALVGDASLAVVACGPAAMADSTRQTTVEQMGLYENRIEYFEESFQW
ncbi:FAD-binding domain [Geosmithia morbida]|uniref:FAD-binding domain n=1 Tax=Geosmithia morbida TaxID=1094350 RepID=A0A9P5D009_9HYPO|nr:FAD-binding domain [Geosmithia morbida]KAF4122223.1 FAD-binding domain [Geosmithia morbida]